jgi:PAS domain S-box-containing protein
MAHTAHQTTAHTEIAQLEHERLTSLINSMADGVIAVDEYAKVVIYNAAALNILDLNSSMNGQSLGKFLKPIDKDNHDVDIVSLVEQTKLPVTNRDLRIKYGDGSAMNLYLSVAPVHLGYGSSGERGYVLLLRDITREKSLEEERDEFISVVSHELRTPIAIAEGNISNAQFIVEKGGDLAQIKQALKEAHSQTLFLADMINDLSTLSRAERGKLTLEVEPINVHELLTELAESHKADAAAKGLHIKTMLDPHLELLYSSRLYVHEVLQNFITNAIKYTEKGHILIGAKLKEGGVEFEVSDTGIGISKTDQERVFDKFFRSEDFRTRATNGTGLGLYVTMKLARLLHAEINLKSELNHGSTFSIFVPSLQEAAKSQ